MKKTLLPFFFLSILFCDCEKESASFSKTTALGEGGSLARFAIDGNFLYTVDDQKLTVFDITDAANPAPGKTIDLGFGIETIFPFRDKLFIGSSSQVYIFSITDPANPQKLASAISPNVLRRCDPVVAKDTVAFATLRTNGPCGGTQSILAVFDIKDVTNPLQKATYPVGEPYGLGYSGDVLYICDRFQGLIVIDISNPYQPVFIRAINDGIYTDVIPYQNTLICWVSTGMILYDISDNRNPVLLAKIN